MEKIIKPIKINRSNFNTYGDLISTNDINPIDINCIPTSKSKIPRNSNGLLIEYFKPSLR